MDTDLKLYFLGLVLAEPRCFLLEMDWKKAGVLADSLSFFSTQLEHGQKSRLGNFYLTHLSHAFFAFLLLF